MIEQDTEERPPRRRPRLVAHALLRFAMLNVLLGTFALVVALYLNGESMRALRTPGGLVTAFGRAAGLLGAYLLLVMVVLLARFPALERAYGRESLMSWHRRIAGWPLLLIVAHLVLITIGYSELDATSVVREFTRLLAAYPDVLAALVGVGVMLLATLLSYRRIRARLSYESWWVLHLYFYLGLALSFAHQLANGSSFVHSELDRVLWSALWIATATAVLAYRVLWPIWRSVRYRLRVLEVHVESLDVLSITVTGRHLDKLKAKGGQFFLWRVLAKGAWLECHPYSLSALPTSNALRATVKSTNALSSLVVAAPGKRVLLEGPFGAFTKDVRHTDKVALIGAGIGVTPLRALLEDLAPDLDAVVLLRASSVDQRELFDETRALAHLRGARFMELIGPREEVHLDALSLFDLISDIAERDVYLCGPDGFRDLILQSLADLAVPASQVHYEAFSY